MSISIVNGYVCTSCADVAKARKGENPADSKEGAGAARDKRDRASDPDPAAVTFGGSLVASGIDPEPRVPDKGSRLDLRA